MLELFKFLEKNKKKENWLLLFSEFLQILLDFYEIKEFKQKYGGSFIPLYNNIIVDKYYRNSIKKIAVDSLILLTYKSKANKEFFFSKKNNEKIM
jgi:hypothetical protein